MVASATLVKYSPN